MPLTPEQKLKMVVDAGLDPKEYTVEDNGLPDAGDPYTALNPPAIKPPSAPATMTGPEAFGTKLMRSLVPSGAALSGMSAAARLPIPHPLLKAGVMLASGLVSGIGGGWGQEKVLENIQSPEDYKKGVARQALAQQSHPVISQLGEFAPNLLAFNPAALPRAGGALKNLLVGARPTIAGAEALAQTGVNAGVSGGLDIAQQKILEKKPEIDWRRAGLATALGGAFAQPYGPVGNRLFPTLTKPTPPTPPEVIKPPMIRGLLPERAGPIITPEPAQRPDPLGRDYYEMKEKLAAAPVIDETNMQLKMRDEASAPVDSEILRLRKELEELNSAYELELENKAARTEFNKSLAGQDQIKQPVKLDLKRVEKVAPIKDEVIPVEGTVEDILAPKPEVPTGAGLRDPNFKYKDAKFVDKQPEQDASVFYQPDVETLKPGLTPEQLTQAKAYAEKRGITLRQVPTIIDPKTKLGQRGSFDSNERVTNLSDIATSDTPHHETFGHGVMEDFRNSKLQGDRRVYEAGVKAAGNPEALAEAIGKRIVDVEDAPLRSWLQDFWSNTKRIARIHGDEDTVNHLARRARDDRPYSESPELWRGGGETIDRTPAMPETTKAGEVKFSAAGEAPPKKQPSSSFVNLLKSPVDTLLDNPHPSHQIAGKAAKDFFVKERELKGKFRALPDIAAEAEEPLKVSQWLHENRFSKGAPTVQLTPADATLVQSLRKPLVEIHDYQRSIDRLVGGERAAKDDPHYSPTVLSNEVAKIFSEGKDTTTIARLKEDYIQHQLKYNKELKGKDNAKELAKEMLDSRLRELNSPPSKGSPEFAAVNTVQGSGLPYSWTEKNPSKLFKRYVDRVAKDFAFHEHIGGNEDARVLYNYKDRYGKASDNPKKLEPITDPALKVIYKQMIGDHTNVDANYRAGESLLRAGFLGTLTGASNHLSGYGTVAGYLPTKDMPKMLSEWKNISRGLAESFAEGVNRKSTLDIETPESGSSFYADQIRKIANNLRKWQGANLIEQTTRGLHMAIGTATGESVWGRIKAGSSNVEDARFMRQFGQEGVNYKTTPITREALRKIGANFVERVQGTYDARGLPSWTLEPTSPAYWLMNLSKWSIERSNIVKKDVINPILTDGDWGPALKYTLGATLSGAAILELRELINNRRNPTPNYTELMDSGKASDWAFKFAEVANLGAFGGIIGDALMMAAKSAKGYGNKSIGIPTVDIAKQTAKDFTDMLGAIDEGQSAPESFLSWAVDTIVNNIQLARIGRAHMDKADDLADSDKRKDLEIYRRLHGKSVSEPGSYEVNKYSNKDVRDFKRGKDLDEAKKILNEKILPRLKDDPDKITKLEGLKKNSYQTVPADRKESKEYLDYIKRTQGIERATALEQDKKAQDRLNHRKSNLVPRR